MPRQITLEQAHKMCDHLEKDVSGKLRHTDVTIQRWNLCSGDCEICRLKSCDWKETEELVSLLCFLKTG